MNKSQLPAAQKEAIGMLLDDHRNVKKLFKDFEKESDARAKEKLVREACTELKVHTRLEEELFYPALRDMDPKAFGKLLDEAVVEHATAKDLIAQLEDAVPGDKLHDAKFIVLGEYVNHHVKEEETELFPKIGDKHLDLRSLGMQMKERREELMAELQAEA